MERLGGLRVLVVDDDEEVRDVIADILAVVGCTVETARTIGEARAKVAWTRPSVVLCDWNLGGERSGPFLCALERERPEIARVLVTGSPPSAWEALVTSGVVQRAIGKPFALPALVAMVARASTAMAARQLTG